MSVQGTSALRKQTKIDENTTSMGTLTCTRQLVLDQHNKSQSHHGLLKLHLVSKNLRKRKTKSLSGGSETLATETLGLVRRLHQKQVLIHKHPCRSEKQTTGNGFHAYKIWSEITNLDRHF